MGNIHLQSGCGRWRIEIQIPRREYYPVLTAYDWAISETLDPWEGDYLNCASMSRSRIPSLLMLQGKSAVLLFCGGGKSTQQRDIRRAREYLADYRRRADA